MNRLVYLRVPLIRLVHDFHTNNMKGQLVEYSYDSRKDEVLIETMIDEEKE